MPDPQSANSVAFDSAKSGLKGGCHNGEIGLIAMFLKKVKAELLFN